MVAAMSSLSSRSQARRVQPPDGEQPGGAQAAFGASRVDPGAFQQPAHAAQAGGGQQHGGQRVERHGAQQGDHPCPVGLQEVDAAHHQVEQPVAGGALGGSVLEGVGIGQGAEALQQGTAVGQVAAGVVERDGGRAGGGGDAQPRPAVGGDLLETGGDQCRVGIPVRWCVHAVKMGRGGAVVTRQARATGRWPPRWRATGRRASPSFPSARPGRQPWCRRGW